MGYKPIDCFERLRKYQIGLVDAGQIARHMGLGGTFNMAMLGAYVRLTQLVKMETLIEAVGRMVPGKKELNIQAPKEAYERTKVFEREG